MKLNKYIWLAALPMIFTACQEDMLVKESSKQGITTLSATMGSDADSRAQIQLGTYPGTFMWNAGDAFTLFESLRDGSIESKEFSIDTDYSDENPSAGANFSISEGNPLISGNSFKAIYPSKENQDAGIFNGLDNVTNVNFISMTITQPQYNMSTLEGDTEAEKIDNFWKTYFKNNLFMKAEGDVTSNTKVSFEHLCGLVRVSYTNNKSQSVTIKEIRLNGQWQKQIYLNENTLERLSMEPDLKSLSFSSEGFNLHVNPNETRDFYFLFFPLEASDYEKFNGIEIDYIPDGNASEYVTYRTPSIYKGKGFVAPIFEAGKTYWFKITETGNYQEGYNLQWTADLEGGNEEGGQPGEGGEGESVEVDSWEKLQDEIKNGNSSEIKFKENSNIYLAAPLTITRKLTIDLNNCVLGLASGIGYDGKGSGAVITTDAELSIKNGFLTTNDGTTEVHRYYIEGKNSNGAIHFDNVILETGSLVKNAVSAGSNPFSLHNSTITTSGYAIHWECKDYSKNFTTTLQNSTVNGSICYVTDKSGSLNKNDEVLIYACTIVGNLVTTLPEDVLPGDIFKMDEYSSAEYSNGNDWTDIGECPIPTVTRQVYDWDDLVRVFEDSKTSKSHLWCVVNDDIELKHPLIAERRISLELKNNKLYVGENFDWQGKNSVFIVNGDQEKGELRIDHGTVEGPSQLDCTGKNFFSNQDGEVLAFYEVTLNAKNIPTACYVKNGLCHFSGSLNTIKASCAFDVKSEGRIAIEHDNGEVEGSIVLTSGSRLTMSNGSIKGDVTMSDNSYFYMYNYNGGGSIDGELEKDDTSGGTVESTVTITNDPNNKWSALVGN